ncbi:MAG: hypothetical protein ACRDHZ_16945 [Ktedonobacteraceae bacterium]
METEILTIDTGQIERYNCPLCDWHHDEKRMPIHPNALASVFGAGMMQTVGVQQKTWRVEQALKDHFATHTTVQWLDKVTSLQHELDVLKQSFP